MGFEYGHGRGPTSPANDVFEVMFQGADILSSFWQPMLKGIGRWQLEVAQLGAKQARATLELGHRVARAENPLVIGDAYRDYWSMVGGIYNEASRNIATAMVRAAPHAAVLELPVMPRARVHDTLQLLDEGRRAAPEAGLERKVA